MLIVVNIVVVVVLLGVAVCPVCPCVHPIYFFLIKFPHLAKNKSRSKHRRVEGVVCQRIGIGLIYNF